MIQKSLTKPVRMVTVFALAITGCSQIKYTDLQASATHASLPVAPSEYGSFDWLNESTLLVLRIPSTKVKSSLAWHQIEKLNIHTGQTAVLQQPTIAFTTTIKDLDHCSHIRQLRRGGADSAMFIVDCRLDPAYARTLGWKDDSPLLYSKQYTFQNLSAKPIETCEFSKPPTGSTILSSFEWLDEAKGTMLGFVVTTYSVRYRLAVFENCRELKTLLPEFYSVFSPALSPSKRHIAFTGIMATSNPNNDRAQLLELRTLYVHELASSKTTELLRAAQNGFWGAIGWSSDESSVFFSGTINNITGIWRMKVADRSLGLIWKGKVRHAAISPDGSKLAIFELPEDANDYINTILEIVDLTALP